MGPVADRRLIVFPLLPVLSALHFSTFFGDLFFVASGQLSFHFALLVDLMLGVFSRIFWALVCHPVFLCFFADLCEFV